MTPTEVELIAYDRMSKKLEDWAGGCNSSTKERPHYILISFISSGQISGMEALVLGSFSTAKALALSHLIPAPAGVLAEGR